MPPGAGGPQHAAAANLEADARNLAAVFAQRSVVVLLILSLVYASGAVLQARGKPLWFDEIITVIAASEPDARSTWNAASKVDANPPLPHVLTHFSMTVFGKNEVGARVPAIAGFWIFCLCLFRFTRRLGVFYAMAAMLIPVATGAYRYALEARAYGAELALCGLALVAWQAAAEGRRRMLSLPLLTVSLAAALLCHYYAVLMFLPIAAGEAVRTRRARRIDWPVWIALAAGGIPVVWRAMTILGVVKMLSNSWAQPSPAQIFHFWESGLQPLAMFLVLLIVLLSIGGRKSGQHAAQEGAEDSLESHEVAAGVVLILLPVVAVVGALLVTHMFTERYALPAFAGFAILAPYSLARLAAGRALLGFFLFGLMAMALAGPLITFSPPENPFTREKELAAALEQGPVVIPDGHLFLQMWYYGPERLRSRMIFLADPLLAAKYMAYGDAGTHSTIDEGLPFLRSLVSVNTIPYADFHPEGGVFLAYHNPLRPGWLLSDVVQRGDGVELIRESPARQLYRIRRSR